MTDALETEQQHLDKLTDPNLLYSTVKEIQKNDIIGEENTILALINKIQLRNVQNKAKTSDNLIVSDQTGGGKDHITIGTCKTLVPEAKYMHRTDISDKTFDYWKPILRWEEIDGKRKPVYDTWNGYVIHLEDPREEALNGQSFKVMSSGGTEVTKVIDHMARDIKIEGKPTIIVTSLKTLLDNENMRRWDTLRIDTTVDQTKAINKYKLQKACGKIKQSTDEILIEALKNNLFPKYVLIPFSEHLLTILPENLLSRTQTDKLLDAIKSSAVLHQYQRERKDHNTIVANYFDLAYGWFVFTNLNSSIGIPMNRDEEELIKVLIEQREPVSINKLSELYPVHSKQWLYNNKEKLTNKSLIKTKFEYSQEANREVEYITFGDNASLVLKGFNEVLKNLDKEGFNAFNGFKEICIRLDKDRLTFSLKPLFAHIFRENLENRENLSIEPLLKPLENPFKTSLLDRVKELKTYCDQLQIEGTTNTYENLCFHFDTAFIEKCKQDGLLLLKKNTYVFYERSVFG